jgi:hypothetical protein
MLGYITDEEFNYRKTNFRMEQENSEIIDIEIVKSITKRIH